MSGTPGLGSRLLIAPIRAYQRFVSPLFPPSCRFQPTCSHYAVEAIGRHGPLKGGWLALRRIGRCHPWGGTGYDPVPQAAIGPSNAPPAPRSDPDGPTRRRAK